MQTAGIVLQQTLTMGLYMLIGVALFRFHKITEEGSRSIATLLLWMVIPSTIIDSFCVSFSAQKLSLLGVSCLLGFLCLMVALLIARILFHKKPIEQFAATFSNAGFIGIPLIRASLGNEAVFYLVGMIILLNLMQWTYGVSILRGERGRVSLRQFLLNPVSVSAVIGLILFFTGIGSRLPRMLSGCISGIAALNAPLAMLVLGVYLAQTELRTLCTSRKLYLVSGVRLLLIPLVTMLILHFIPVDPLIRKTLLIATAAPAGANTAIYAQVHGADYRHACQTVTQSTVLSIGTLPFILMISEYLF